MTGPKKTLLAVLWFAAGLTVAIEVAADCTNPTEVSPLTLEAVSVEGAQANPVEHVGSTPPVMLSMYDGTVTLRSGTYLEQLPTEVAP